MTAPSTTLATLPTSPETAPTTEVWYAPGNLMRGLIPVAVLVGWHLLSTSGVIRTQLFPSPVLVVEALGELIESGDLQAAVPVSLARAGTGLALGLSIGIGGGIVAGLFRRGEQLFDSSFQIVRQIPFIAMVPLFIIWFGINEEFKVIVVTLACIFPAYLNTYSGVRYVDAKLVEAGRVFGLSQRQQIFQIVLPAALPQVLVGVRYSVGTSLLALIVAEQVNTKSGIGYIIVVAQSAIRIDIITAAILIYAVLGIAVDVLMRFVERTLIPWK